MICIFKRSVWLLWGGQIGGGRVDAGGKLGECSSGQGET